MEKLIQKYQHAKEYADKLYQEILNTSDGFLYVTQLRCYGSITWDNHTNEFSVQQLCDEYYGDNGIVDVFTNNPNNTISSYGNIKVMTEDEIINMSKENISMTNAITSWMTKGL